MATNSELSRCSADEYYARIENGKDVYYQKLDGNTPSPSDPIGNLVQNPIPRKTCENFKGRIHKIDRSEFDGERLGRDSKFHNEFFNSDKYKKGKVRYPIGSESNPFPKEEIEKGNVTITGGKKSRRKTRRSKKSHRKSSKKQRKSRRGGKSRRGRR